MVPPEIVSTAASADFELIAGHVLEEEEEVRSMFEQVDRNSDGFDLRYVYFLWWNWLGNFSGVLLFVELTHVSLFLLLSNLAEKKTIF